MTKKNLAIFASGSGTNAENILVYFSDHPLIEVPLILTNNPQAGVISRVRKYEVPVLTFNREQLYQSNWVVQQLHEYKIDALVLAGFLWLVPKNILKEFPGMLNLHPALLPKYGGKGMYGDHVHQAVIAAGEVESGITIHEVNTEYDKGRILFQTSCPVFKDDTPASLAKRIHSLEYKHFPKVIENWLINLKSDRG